MRQLTTISEADTFQLANHKTRITLAIWLTKINAKKKRRRKTCQIIMVGKHCIGLFHAPSLLVTCKRIFILSIECLRFNKGHKNVETKNHFSIESKDASRKPY